MAEDKEVKRSVVFAVNKERFEIFGNSFEPSTTLLEFLRNRTPFKSVKLGCGEGGCGSCVVLISKYNPFLNKVDDFTASSCLVLLSTINGYSITTSEGLGNTEIGFHSIHQRFAGFHASQCGFCTPGMCMSLFGSLVNAEKTNRPVPPSGFSKLTVSEAETSIAGNLCRCTGYRPIADVCKSYAGDVDIEDLGFNSFWKTGEPDSAKLPKYDPDSEITAFPEFLKPETCCSLQLDFGNATWYQPCSFEELQSLLRAISVDQRTQIKFVVGNTSLGYYKEHEYYDKYVDLQNIPEFLVVRWDPTGVEIGAAVTISKAIEVLREANVLESKIVFEKLAGHMEKIASKFVRNLGSIGGNLVMAQRRHFPSDVATILLGAGSFVSIITGTVLETVSLEEFLERPPLDPKSILLSVKIPTYEFKGHAGNKLLFETYRAAPRPLGNALAYMNAAFLAEISCPQTSGGVLLSNCRLSFGAFGTKHAIRAKDVETFLTGKLLTVAVLREAIELVKAAVVPEEGTPNRAYRSSLAVSFLFRFFGPLINNTPNFSPETPTLLLPSKQVIPIDQEYYPVGSPVIKSGARLQASGEAIYVDDIPAPENCLHGAFIYSTKAKARVKTLELKSLDGVSGLISYKDIPKGGENLGSLFPFGSEPLFAEEVALFSGQPIALVLADTQKHADVAASLAVVDYDLANLEPPILTVEDAVKNSSFFEVLPTFYPKQVGDISIGMSASDHQILSSEIRLESQYFFYMETQTALTVPDEDNCIVVYTSNQMVDYTQMSIARCLGVPVNNVRVITRRVGGGFGGKANRAIPVATACALAAVKLQRPVRMYLNRKSDMIYAGGRHPMKVTYSVGFKSNGKLTGLQLQILVNCGISIDASPLMPISIINSLKKYNWGALSFDIKLCKTNLVTKSMMRAPGDVQGSYIAEVIIENVASCLSIDVDTVRAINLHSYESLTFFYPASSGDPVEYTLPAIWDKLAITSGFTERAKTIEEFNRTNIWKKRGIARVPVVYELGVRPTPGKVSILSDGSVVVEVGGIELGQGLWTKVKQMAAFALGSINVDGASDLLDKVRVIQNDTLSLTQGGLTVGSTTSESSCEAVRLCCNVLTERLTPELDRLKMQTSSVTWEMLIEQVYLDQVHLSANSYFVPDPTSVVYLNFGAAVSEVEIDLLTGQTTIIRSDIIYDCGRSLNPAVDLGQIEGAFVQGIGLFMLEEYTTDAEGLFNAQGTWAYKIPTIDTIPKQLNVEILNSGNHQKRVLSSKASGEPPLLLAVSVHSATRGAIREARKQVHLDPKFQLDFPANMPVVKELCGLDYVERNL